MLFCISIFTVWNKKEITATGINISKDLDIAGGTDSGSFIVIFLLDKNLAF